MLLPGKSHGRRSLVGCSPWGCEESDTTERLHFHFSLSRIGEGNGNPLQCSCLENPRDGGAWWAAIYGVSQCRTQLNQLSSSSSSNSKNKQNKQKYPPCWPKMLQQIIFKSEVEELPWWSSGCDPNSGGLGSIPGWGTRSHIQQQSSHAATKDQACRKEDWRYRMPQPRPRAAK